MPEIRVPTLTELLERIPDKHLMSGPQLAAAIGAEEALNFFRQFSAQLAEEKTTTT